MKKNYFFKLLLLSIPLAAFALIASSGGRDDARTGSPGDSGNTCAQCHTGGTGGASVAITTNIPAGGFDLNTEYDITVTTTSSAIAHGFQLTAERLSDNTKIGSFTAGTGSRVTGQRVTHSGTGQSSWTFKWMSPSAGQGLVKFYAASVAANGDGSNGSPDFTVTTSSGNFTALGISEARLLEFSMFPNPTSDVLNIQLPTGTDKAEVGVFDYTGRLVSSKTVTLNDTKLDVNNLSNGMYIIRVTSDDKIGAQRFIKN